MGAEIIPDPTTAGDFLRRFDQDQIIELMEAKNEIRKKIWEKQPQCFKEEAIINVDGTIAETFGDCKEGMEISYNGKWGYHPLIISLANTREPLYLINRPANAPSHLDSDDVRYFFYITNDLKSSKEQVLEFYRKRADHENDIEQLKNGARALQAPSNTLLSNWAYMVVASTEWDLKAWYGLLMPYRHMGKRVVRMEFKSFINAFIRIPCLIIRTARKIVYRLVGYNDFLKHALNFFRAMKQPCFS